MSVLDNYELDWNEIPSRLYRIHYAGSQTTWSREYGFQAASGFTPLRLGGLCNAVENHLDWSHRQYKSPFISTFGNKPHALNWANQWIDRNHGACWLNEIYVDEDTYRNGDEFGIVRVFGVQDLLGRLNISVSLNPSQYKSEYLFLHRIPEECIVQRTRLL